MTGKCIDRFCTDTARPTGRPASDWWHPVSDPERAERWQLTRDRISTAIREARQERPPTIRPHYGTLGRHLYTDD